MHFLIFSSIFLLVMISINIYIWRRFLRHLFHHNTNYLLFIPVLLLLGNIFFIIDIKTGFIPDSPALYILSSSFVGMTFMIFIIAIIYDLSISIANKVAFEPSRRRVLKIIFDVTLLIGGLSYLLRAFSQGVKFPEINHIKVKIKDFPLEQFKIVQLTDVHVGRTIKRDFIEQLVKKTNQLKPDIVVITGDLVDLSIHQIKDDLLPLKNIKAETYFVLGNHEYFHDPKSIIYYLTLLGITPLLNQNIIINKEGKQFNLLGINDVIGERAGIFPANIQQTYNNVDQNNVCIVLAHQPRMINELDSYRCDLMLSGHTHGGQIFPFGLLVMTAQPYLAGLYQHSAEKQIFVSRGTGYWGPPMRFLAPSEISEIVLQGEV